MYTIQTKRDNIVTVGSEIPRQHKPEPHLASSKSHTQCPRRTRSDVETRTTIHQDRDGRLDRPRCLDVRYPDKNAQIGTCWAQRSSKSHPMDTRGLPMKSGAPDLENGSKRGPNGSLRGCCYLDGGNSADLFRIFITVSTNRSTNTARILKPLYRNSEILNGYKERRENSKEVGNSRNSTDMSPKMFTKLNCAVIL